MEHRPEPQLTFAQASLSNGNSVARISLQIAVPTLSMVLLILWLARLTVSRLQWRRVAHLAQSWDTLPNYAQALEVANALRLRQHHEHTRSTAADEHSCTICFATDIEHPVALLPCGHQQYCARCIVQLWEHTGVYRQLKCPLCRQPVELMCPVQVAGSTPSIDDALLLQKYNGGFCGAKKHSLLDKWVLRLRAVTSARLLPFVIGLRIAVLHATIFTYIILPLFASDAADAATTTAASTGVTAEVATNDSVVVAACAAAVRVITAVLHYAVTYADDLFVVAISIILTGSLLQCTLFKDLKL